MRLHLQRGIVFALFTTLLVPGRFRAQEGILLPIRGFLPSSVAEQARYEEAFLKIPSAARARRHLRILSAKPHVAGTPEDYQTALYVRDRFREFGLPARLVEYRVLLPTPELVRVELLEPVQHMAPTPEVDFQGKADGLVMTPFNAYSPSGDVAAEVVYANYGLPEDYERLRELGVDAAGKIVLVRYGRCFRGVKAAVAHRQGAAGLILYSDPQQDGYRQGDPYPKGPWRPPTGVQRGSILNLSIYPGDPLTPGYPAVEGAHQVALEEAKNLPKIPTVPLSYKDAEPILKHLRGPTAPREWQGALPFTYHVGPGASRVRLTLKMNFEVRPIWNVIAEIRGKSEPDRWVVLGNHRDSWTYGAVDALSGTAPLLEVARGLGALVKRGWRPRRTIILASWDGEEYGLLGSTEWVEDHAEFLSRNSVAYLNVDVGVAGPHFRALAVPSLASLVREVTRKVKDPKSGRSVYLAWLEEASRLRSSPGLPIIISTEQEGERPRVPPVGELGSGSDYTPFFQHLGIPSVDVGFGGPYGVYHALHDNFHWMARFGDPDFSYSVAVSRIWGLLALRLANADLLPYDYEAYGRKIEEHLQRVKDDLEESGRADRLSVDETLQAVAQFIEAAGRVRRRLRAFPADESNSSRTALQGRVNDALMRVERDFLLPSGLPGRSWFRHAIYAPGVYTGYSAVPLPGLRESIDAGDWWQAQRQEAALREVLRRATARLQGIVTDLDIDRVAE